MANITRVERERRRQADTGEAPFGGTAYEGIQDQIDAVNAIDERAPDRRPATVTDITGPELVVADDNRAFSGNLGKAVNQMAGRAVITENHDPLPQVTAANNPPVVPNPQGAPVADEGDEVQLLRGYVPRDAVLVNDQGVKRVKGEVVKLPKKEARWLVNEGFAKFTDVG